MSREWRDDMPDIAILRQSYHKTRRDRRCVCGRVFPAGTRYMRTVGKIDGEFFSSVQCTRFSPDYDCPYPTAKEAAMNGKT